MKWTTQQDAAINTSGRSLIVSAAAGSGKTAVLVERLVRILQDREQQVRADSMSAEFANYPIAIGLYKLFHGGRNIVQMISCFGEADRIEEALSGNIDHFLKFR